MDKRPGVRPIGIGEVLRRIVGKALTSFLKQDIVDTVGPLQLSAGAEVGAEAAIHAMEAIYQDPECQAVLLVDASNAFNSLNRSASLLNIRHICPEISTYLINTYRDPSRLYISNSGGHYIMSNEGTTQGDNCASAYYSLGIQPIVEELNKVEDNKQIWYADDAGTGGKLNALKEWWDKLTDIGPRYGYFPNPSKTWLIVKPEYMEDAEAIFNNTGVKFTTDGHVYLFVVPMYHPN